MLRTRVLTGIVLGIVVAGAIFLLATPFAALVFGAFWIVGAYEWARLADIRQTAGRVAYAAILAVFVGVALLGVLPDAAGDALLWLAAICWVLAFVLELRFPTPLPAAGIAVAGPIVLGAAWLAFLRLHGAGPDGPGLVLAGLVIVWSADIGAFFVGRRFGKRHLAPRLSPKKTWEGVAGGFAGAAVAGAIAAILLKLPVATLVPVAVAMALISVVGDLGVSMLKRRVGLKDTGMLLPGHGGIMDRFDGVTAALPCFVLGLQFAHVLD